MHPAILLWLGAWSSSVHLMRTFSVTIHSQWFIPTCKTRWWASFRWKKYSLSNLGKHYSYWWWFAESNSEHDSDLLPDQTVQQTVFLPRNTNNAPTLKLSDIIVCASIDKLCTPFLISVWPVHKYILQLLSGFNMKLPPVFPGALSVARYLIFPLYCIYGYLIIILLS